MKTELEDLHRQLVKRALAKLKSDECTAAEMTAALNLLKHNNISSLPEADKNLSELKSALDELGSLPFTGSDS